jgi:hypothetical protein
LLHHWATVVLLIIVVVLFIVSDITKTFLFIIFLANFAVLTVKFFEGTYNATGTVS